MQIESLEKAFLDGCLIAGTKKEPIRNYNSSTTILLQTSHDQNHEQIGCFSTSHLRREILLNLLQFRTAVRRIHQDHRVLLRFLVLVNLASQRVPVNNIRNLDTIEKEISNAKQIWQRLLFNTVKTLPQQFAIFVGSFFSNRSKQLTSGIQKTTSTAGEVSHRISKLKRNVCRHKVCQSTRRVELTR